MPSHMSICVHAQEDALERHWFLYLYENEGMIIYLKPHKESNCILTAGGGMQFLCLSVETYEPDHTVIQTEQIAELLFCC